MPSRIPRPQVLIVRTNRSIDLAIGPIAEGGVQDVRVTLSLPALSTNGEIASKLHDMGLMAYKGIPFEAEHIPYVPKGLPGRYLTAQYADETAAFMCGECQCEAHPGATFPHGDCPGPGAPWPSSAAAQ